VTRTQHKVKEVFHWDNPDRDVAEFVQTCGSCQRVKAQRRKPQSELHPVAIPSRRWESISLDLITDLPRSKQGFDSIVVFVDRLSKMDHMAPCTKQVSAIGLVRLFENHVWKLHGLPDNFVSDRDVRFQAEFWKCFCEHFGI
jgi:hypothetical protein